MIKYQKTFSFEAKEILVIGMESSLEECRLKFGDNHIYQRVGNHSEAEKILKPDAIVFDFEIDDDSDGISLYRNFDGIAFLGLSKKSLKQLINSAAATTTFFGFCGMPTFLNRGVLEVSLHRKIELERLKEVCEKLNTKFAVVNDQVGLVTARVICMIINEAYFSIQEHIASRGDIDLAMKLGTNYPFGPFEWSDKIGLKNVYEMLNAVYENTKDERYKICELLKEEALR